MKLIIHLDEKYYDAPEFIIETVNNSKDNKYIQSAAINSASWNKTWFSHDEIKNGSSLVFEMGAQPNKNWGTKPEDAPPSMTKN